MKICVVIPCYKVTRHIEEVIRSIGNEVARIYAIDDACPEGSGKYIQSHCTDPRLKVLINEVNLGVGGAVKRGYRQALADGMDIVVKLDGDGQMDPREIPALIAPIVLGQADYSKGNRFYSWWHVKSMPKVRLFGNGVLSFMTKISSGYWNISDPTNGFTAISTAILRTLHLDGVSDRYFFESDMLYNLYLSRGIVVDVPLKAIYRDEESNLSPFASIIPFTKNNFRNTCKRVLYMYFLRDFSIASCELAFGGLLLLFGMFFGSYHWLRSAAVDQVASTGTVMLAALPTILGFQMILSFINFDVNQVAHFSVSRLNQKNLSR